MPGGAHALPGTLLRSCTRAHEVKSQVWRELWHLMANHFQCKVRNWSKLLQLHQDKRNRVTTGPVPQTTATPIYYSISDSRQIFCLVEAFIPAKTATSNCSPESACAQFIANSAQVCTSKITCKISD